jgi:hypothetical protein
LLGPPPPPPDPLELEEVALAVVLAVVPALAFVFDEWLEQLATAAAPDRAATAIARGMVE